MAQDYDYGQLLDDFELGADVMPGETLTEYIERRRREFDSKADGGVIGIEVKIADEMAKGGRVGLLSGGMLKGLASLFKSGKDKIDDIIETKAMEKVGFRSKDDIPLSTYSEMKGPMKLSDLENIPEDQLKKILRTQELGLYEETPELLKAANLLQRFTKKVGGKRVIDYDRAEAILNVKLKGNETLDELFKIEFQTRPENRLADGGRVGLFMGGPALEGQALDIYNSMNAYGFSDQQIADALSARGLYGAESSGTTQPANTGIINQQINQGDDRVTELQETFTKDLSGDPRFNYLEPTAQANKYRFDRSVEPRDGLLGFFDSAMNKMKESSFFQPKIRGTLGTRMANQPMIPLPAAIASYSRSPFNIKSPNYNPLMEAQLNFAETQEGIIGRNPNTGLLQYGPESVLAGKNVISMFGTNDYEKMLQDYISKMNANKKISATAKAAKLAQAQKELEELQKKTEAARAAQYGKIDYGRGSDGQRSYDFGEGFGRSATTGGPVSNRTGRGRTDYSKGGLATMFTRRR